MLHLPLHLLALCTLSLPHTAPAPGGEDAEAAPLFTLRGPQESVRESPPRGRFDNGPGDLARPVADYPDFFELSFGDNVAELGYRRSSRTSPDYFGASVLATDDDDVAVHAHLVRQGTIPDVPARVGVGIGGWAMRLDSPRENVYALGILGTAEYDVATEIPVTFSARAGFAPSITTWDDGDNVKDLRVEARADLSDTAAVYLGVRVLQTNTTRDHRVDEGLHLGIRLAL